MTDLAECHARSARPTRRRLSLFALALRMTSLRQERRRLAQLEDHLLRDIGVTPDQAATEAARAPWDAPLH